MTAIRQVKAALAQCLSGAGLAAVSAFEEERLKRYAEPVVVVGARRVSVERTGLLDYLGERYDESSGSTVEVYGRTMKLTLSLDVYSPREKGASVRAVTTRTTTGGASDTTWRELTTILIVDDVIPTIRSSLRSRFARSKNTAQSRGAIRSQVILELEDKLASERIDSYGEVKVSAIESDPTACLVEFSFAVAHGLTRIYLTAHITV